MTVTATRATRSAGGPHDFYSEGDYWWPDPKNPDGPYVQRDGQTNPDNFVAHRDAMRRLSQIVPALVAAYELTDDRRYARRAADHLRAWFVAESTRMNPNLLYGQAIKGVATGRGIGIIDTIHLVEVAQAVRELERRHAIDAATLAGTKAWFRDYLAWMTTHPYGIAERDNGNNHSAAWALQVAEYGDWLSRLLGQSAHHGDCLRVLFVRAVREVHTGDVHARLDQPANGVITRGGGAKRADDLCTWCIDAAHFPPASDPIFDSSPAINSSKDFWKLAIPSTSSFAVTSFTEMPTASISLSSPSAAAIFLSTLRATTP